MTTVESNSRRESINCEFCINPLRGLTLLLLGKARKRSLLSLNRKVVNCFVPSPPHSFKRLLFTPAAGYRHREDGLLFFVGAETDCWSSSTTGVSSPGSSHLFSGASQVHVFHDSGRSVALPVRCVQASAREVCHSRCRRCRQRDAFHPKGPGMRGGPINRRFPLPPKRSPGSPERPNFQRKPTPQPRKHPKRRAHPNRPNAENTNTRKSPKHPPAPDSMDSENPPGYRNAAPDRGHPSRPEQHKKARTVTRSRYAEEAAPSAVRPAYLCSPRIRIAASRMAVSSNVTTPPSGPGSKWTPTHSLASCLPPK